MQPSQFYDLIIDFNDLEELGDSGWRIEESENYQNFKALKNIPFPVVSILGGGNKGKTHLVQRLLGESSVLKIPTKGINIKFPKDKKGFIVIDSLGFDAPLLKRGENQSNNKLIIAKEVDDESLRRNMAKKFLENFLLSISDIIIIVVEFLTSKEQIEIEKIKRRYQKKNIYIIHNLMSFVNDQQTRDYYHNILEKILIFNVLRPNNLILSNKSGCRYFSEKNGESEVIHLIIRNDIKNKDSIYNSPCYKFLGDEIQKQERRTTLDIIEKLKGFLAQFSKENFQEEIQLDQIVEVDRKIELEEKKKISYVFTPPYSYRKVIGNPYIEGDKSKYFLIILELPGNVKDLMIEANISEGKYHFKISGEKENDKWFIEKCEEIKKKLKEQKKEIEENNIHGNYRINGKFFIKFSIELSKLNLLSLQEPFCIKDLGYYLFYYKLSS